MAEAREFAELQRRDEERHTAFFRDCGKALRVPRPVFPQLEALFAEARTATTLPYLLLANHLVVESLAHELFRDVASLFDRMGTLWILPRR